MRGRKLIISEGEPRGVAPSQYTKKETAPRPVWFASKQNAERPERVGSGLHTVRRMRGAQGCRHLQATIAARGPRPACIKLKFTTNRQRQFWKMRSWLTEEAAPGVPPPETASPVHLSRWQGMTGPRILSPNLLHSR